MKLLLLGDSITDFGGYAALMETIFRLKNMDVNVLNLGVSSENTSGLAEPWHPFVPRPNIHNRLDVILKEIEFDTVVIMYGVNDGIYYPYDEKIFDSYKNGMNKLIDRLKEKCVKIIVCTPTFFDLQSCKSKTADTLTECEKGAIYKNYDDVMEIFAEYVKNEISKKADKIVDIHEAMKTDVLNKRKIDKNYISGDGIHPNINGNAVIAETILNEGFGINVDICSALKNKYFNKLYLQVNKKNLQEHYFLKEKIGHENIWKAHPKKEKNLLKYSKRASKKLVALQLKTPTRFNGKWNGFLIKRFDFIGYKATIIFPKILRKGNNIVWKTEFLNAFTDADIALINRGFALIFLDAQNFYGSPAVISLMEKFFTAIQTYFPFGEKIVFLALSRGGLSAVNYTAKHPEQVAALYLDAPVIDIDSWPLGKGEGVGSAEDVILLKQIYGEISFEKARNAVFVSAKIIKENKIPVLIVSNKYDDVVPYEENGLKLANILGENVKIIIKNQKGHQHGGLSDPKIICDWVEDNVH